MRGFSYTEKHAQGRHRSSIADKVRWLRNHRDLWLGIEYNQELQRTLVGYMKAARLIARSTYCRDVHIQALISLALKRDS